MSAILFEVCVVMLMIDRIYTAQVLVNNICNETYHESDIVVNFVTNNSIFCNYNIIAPVNNRILVTIVDLIIPQESDDYLDHCNNYLSFSPVLSSNGSHMLKLCPQLTSDVTLIDYQKQIFSINNSLNIEFLIDNRFSVVNIYGYILKIEFVRMCQNVTLIANNSRQQYCSTNYYLSSYSKTSDMCFVQIVTQSDNNNNNGVITMNVTKLITSEYLPKIGAKSCKQHFIELLVDKQVIYNLCGNWSQTDLLTIPPIITSANTSVIVKIYAYNYNQHITDWSLLNNTSLGFCLTYERQLESPKIWCQTSMGWLNTSDYCYKVFYNKKTWFEAQEVCKQLDLNGSLVSITSNQLQKLLDDYLIDQQIHQNFNNNSTSNLNIESDYAFWIGGTDTLFENNYQWVDGNDFQYTNWFPGWPVDSTGRETYGAQPSDDGFSQQNCIEIRNQFFMRTNKGMQNTHSFYWNDISCDVRNPFICQIPKLKDDDKLDKLSLTESIREPLCNKDIVLTSYYPWEVISSPNYPFLYPNNLNCTVRVSAMTNSAIEVLFTDFLIEDGGKSCLYDYITIEDSMTVHKYCGDWTEKIKLLRVLSDSNLTIHMFTDGSHTQRGFRAELRLIDKRHELETTLCDNQLFRHSNGKCYLITSYPSVSWPTAHRICHDIKSQLININSITDDKSLINLLINNSYTERGADLLRANRTFWLNNDNIIREEVDSWVGHNINEVDNESNTCVAVVIDKYGTNKLHYKSIGCNSAAGYVCVKHAFELKITENTTEYNSLEGTLYSSNYPNYYFNDMFYTTNVLLNLTNAAIIVWFDTIDIEWQKDCLYDYLTIGDSNQKWRQICGQITDRNELFNETFISMSNSISITFKSDFSNRGHGFKLHWKAFALNWCDINETVIHEKDVKQQTDYYIDSPGYPILNIPQLNCTVNIIAKSNKKVLLTVVDFDLTDLGEEFCKYDINLSINLGQTKTIQLCGSLNARNILIGQQFISYDNSLKIHYTTSSSLNSLQSKRGFRFSYSFVDRKTKVLSLIWLPLNQLGKVTNFNYPHECPNDYYMYLKTEISHQIELRLPRLTYMKINDGVHCELTTDQLILHVIDPFGDIRLTPANPTIWSVCSESSEPFKTFSTLRSTETKVIKSKFNVLHIRPANKIQRNSFMFYYKIKKDLLFFNQSIHLTQKLPLNTCEYKPCINNGYCIVNERNESYCKCSDLWTGIFCHLTPCDRKPCGNHGICELNKDSSDGYVCHCDSGYIGSHCENTISVCSKSNPCGDRGSCSLINGQTQCKCYPWYEGTYCDRFAFKIQYKPLSKKMMEEPFWLGLMCVGTVLALLSIVYCIKKKFAERIEAFFAEEIEKSKSNFSIPRYSLQSNVGVNVNVSPINLSPIHRSRSTLMTRFKKYKRRHSNMNHFSDPEAGACDQLSDAESGIYNPIPSFIRHASSAKDDVSEEKHELNTTRILQSLVSTSNSAKNRRLSLDEFIQNNRHLRLHRLMQQNIDQSQSDVSLSDGESSFISSAKSPTSSPGRRSPVNLMRQFSAISEASQEDQYSRVTSRNNTLPDDSSSDSLSFLHNSPVMKQESETEILLNDIQSIQQSSQLSHHLYDRESPQPSSSGYMMRHDKLGSTTSSTSSGASTPNRFFPPAITVTNASIEHYYDSDVNCSPHPSLINRSSYDSNGMCELMVPVQTVRRLSEPSPKAMTDGKRSPSPSSQSCCSPMIKKTIESTKGRKFSLEMIPRIQINTEVAGDTNTTPNPCKKTINYLNPMVINAASDRTISESNLSTSGYSSFSSPGISRCNSSSPFPEEIGGVNAELTTIVIPDVPQLDFKHNSDFQPSYGNFLSIPVFTFPVKESKNKTKSPTSNKPDVICPQIKISPAESDERLDIYNQILDDEGIDCGIEFIAKESKENKKYISIEMQSRPVSLFSGFNDNRDTKRQKKLILSPTHSLEEFNMDSMRKTDTLRTPKIRRNPSWPAVIISPNSTSSSEYEENKNKNKKSIKRTTYLTTKVKKLHKKRLKSKSKQRLQSSLSVGSYAVSDNCLSTRSSGRQWFQTSSHSSSTESFLSTNEDDNTVISGLKSRKNNSSQSLCDRLSVCDINTFNTNTDNQYLSLRSQKHTIASISDSALDKSNKSINSLETTHLSKPVSSSLESRKRCKRTIHKQKAMQEDDYIYDKFLEKQKLLERSFQ